MITCSESEVKPGGPDVATNDKSKVMWREICGGTKIGPMVISHTSVQHLVDQPVLGLLRTTLWPSAGKQPVGVATIPNPLVIGQGLVVQLLARGGQGAGVVFALADVQPKEHRTRRSRVPGSGVWPGHAPNVDCRRPRYGETMSSSPKVPCPYERSTDATRARRQHPTHMNSHDCHARSVAVNEPFSACCGLAELKGVDGFGEASGAVGAAA